MKRTLAERFWAKVDKTGECWEWTAAVTAAGYGLMGSGVGKGTVYAHRLSYALHHGPIPDGLLVRHRCDNTRCVRPEHLLLGTDADNMTDKAERGRAALKLSEAAVRHIRGSIESCRALGRKHGVNPSMISRIRKMKAWRHVQ